MAPQPPTHLLSPSELSYLHTSLSLTPPIRPDARLPTSFRPLTAEVDLLPSTNGSARICFVDGTEAVVGVKGEVERSGLVRKREEEGREGGGMDVDREGGGGEGERGDGEDTWVEVSVDMPGYQRDDDAVIVFLGAMIHEALVADGFLRRKLIINDGWHWRLFIDILLLSPPHTYPLPLLSLTTHLALLHTRLPASISSNNEDPMFNDDWDAAILLYPHDSSARPPITLLVMAVGDNIFFDPSAEELAVGDGVLAASISTNDNTTLTSSDRNKQEGVKVLAIRTIDPPSRIAASAAGAGAGAEEGVWQAKRGGLSRKIVARVVGMVTERGGVGEEVLGGVGGFVG